MLALKECLIREGVLNINPSNATNSPFNDPATPQYEVNSSCTLYGNRYSFGSHLNMLNKSLKKSATDVSVNDLSSSNSATAKTSFQQHKQSESTEQESTTKPQASKLPKRYQGHHPHFHHHTAPAYYTDLHLKIHTPEAKDSVNENYQSVYRTPSKLIKDEHQFPKTTTALSNSPQQSFSKETAAESVQNPRVSSATFFPGPHSDHTQQNRIDSSYMSSNRRSLKPSKGNSSSPSDFILNEANSKLPLAAPVQTADGSVVFACTNFKPCVTVDVDLPPQIANGRGRSNQRFASRKRAIRVRSESRPISALYDIICKEKGLDIATTTTNDEDSSSSHSHDEDKAHANTSASRTHRSHSRSVSRQTKCSVNNSNNYNMSGGLSNNSSGGDHAKHKSALQQRKRNEKYSPNTICINDLSDDDDNDVNRLEGGCSRKNFRLRNTHKKGHPLDELKQNKSSSLPPALVNHNSHGSLSDVTKNNHKEPLVCVRTSCDSKVLPNPNANHTASSNPSLSLNITTTTLSVEPIHLHLSSSSLNVQPHTGAGTSKPAQQHKQPDQLLQQQHLATASPKSDRYSRKHRRLRDDKPRRHTDGAIQLHSSELNDFDGDDIYHHNNDNNDDHHQPHHHVENGDFYSDDDDYDDENQQPHPSQIQNLNGAGHDFHTSAGNAAANAKRFITRSQRVQQQQTNDFKPFLAVTNSSAVSEAVQQDLNPSTNSETASTATTFESNGHTIKTNGEGRQHNQEEMTNNSGKKSKTTSTATANPKELKLNISLKSGAASTESAVAATDVSNLSTTVLKQRKQNSTTNCSTATATAAAILSPSKYRKCPLSPLIFTTNAPLLSTTSLSSTSQQLVTTMQTQPQPLAQQYSAKLSPASPALGFNFSPQSPNSTSTCSSSVHLVRTTKTTRLRAAALDKKKDEEKQQNQQRFASPTSPKTHHNSLHNRRSSPSSNCLDNQKQASGSEVEHNKMSSANSSPTLRGNRKLIPSVSVSMKQNLSETQCTASRLNSIRPMSTSPKSPKQKLQTNSTECVVKITTPPCIKTKSSNGQNPHQQYIDNNDDIDSDFLEINDLPSNVLDNDEGNGVIRPRCSTMYTDSDKSKSSLNCGQNSDNILALSPVNKCKTSNGSPICHEERDKSSKRKSNLNRSLNEEATPDGDESAMRRRRRRELGMSRPLIPNDDGSMKALLSPHKTRIPSPTKPAIRNDLAYHMEMARRGLDLATTSERRKVQTTSPKHVKESPSPRLYSPQTKVNMGELRKDRCSEVNRKLNERTRTGLEEIMKIVENVSDSSLNAGNAINELTQSINRLRASQEKESVKLVSNSVVDQRKPSPVKHATFMQEERIYYEPDPLEHIEVTNGETKHLKGGMLRSLRMLKAKSIERETTAYEPTKLSPILRRKSTDCPPNTLSQANTASATPNHIVSILKKKDHLSAGESSSASSNVSPVTFSASVMDTPSKQKRAGILKKRSSLDESRYYSRSHSPDERSILIKSARRNSLEEIANGSSSLSSTQGTAHHGILKQSSYDSSKSDGCPSATREHLQPHSILKKKDSTSTPSDGAEHAPKHVSISQAVILAAAELSAAVETGDKFPNDDYYTPTNEEYDIKPILKLDSFTGDESIKPPKPILKKKSSGESDEHEIKPILKTSRKSSREEFEFGPYSDSESQQGPQVKPILKTDSPSKRRSLGEHDSSNVNPEGELRETLTSFQLKRRTRSLERQDQAPVIDLAAALNAIATSQALPSELVSSLTNSTAGSNISVAERIKSVEKFLANQSGLRSSPSENPPTAPTSSINTSLDSPVQNDSNCSSGSVAGAVKILKPSVIRRDFYKDRFKTQPVTNDEKNCFKTNVLTPNDSFVSGSFAFKPAQSLGGLSFTHLSSHGNQSSNALPSAFTLTRSFTQPLSINTPPQSASSFKAGVPVPLPRKSPARSSLLSSKDTNNFTLSFTGDSGLSCNSNSEAIFEMSSLEQDFDMTESQEPKSNLNKTSAETSASPTGIVRTNSVRARANMFQQMQEKTGASSCREECTSPKRVPRHLSPSPAANIDEPKTQNNPAPLNPDDEIASPSTKHQLNPNAPRGIFKSKSGCGGFMPMDLSNELKNRLKSSQHATVSNLSKTATNLNAATTSLSSSTTAQHDDAVSLVRNLSNLGKPSAQLRDPLKTEPDIASASEGESSGGREISEIIKNSAVARRRKLNEGFSYSKLKNLPPPATAQQFWPYKQNPCYVQQQLQQQQHL